MVRISTAFLVALVMTKIVSAQSPYALNGYYATHGPQLHRDVPATYRPAVLRTISDHRYDRGVSFPTRVVADRFLTNQPSQWTYGGRSCGNAAPHAYPGHKASNGDWNTQRVLYDRDKYVKNNIYGDDTIYDRDQPIRNIFRFVFP